MTHTTVVTKHTNQGSQRAIEAVVTISSYTTGGEDLSDLTDQLGSLDSVGVTHEGATAWYLWNWVKATNKLALATATGTQVTAAVNVGVFYIRVVGV